MTQDTCRCGRGTYQDTRDHGRGESCCRLCGLPTFECLCPRKDPDAEDPHVPFDLEVALSGRVVLLERGVDYEEISRVRHVLLIAAARKGLRLKMEELYEDKTATEPWALVVQAEVAKITKKIIAQTEYPAGSSE